MNPLWQRRLHRCARTTGWVAGVAVIALAVLIALAQLLLPLLARHPAWVAAQLSQRLHRPVSFASMDSRWSASGPEFTLHRVSIGAAAGESGVVMQLPEAELKLDVGAWLLPSRHLLNLRVRGLQLDVLRDADGWHVNGIGVAGQAERKPLSLDGLSVDLWLDEVQVTVTDTLLGTRHTWSSSQLRVSHQGDHVRFGGTLRRAGVVAAVRTVGRFRDDGRAGRIWASVNSTELKPLFHGIYLGGYTADHGSGKLSAWFDWHEGELSRSLIRFDLDTLAVTAPGGGTAHVAALHGLAGIRQTDGGYDVRWAGDDGSALALDLQQPGTSQLRIAAAASDLHLAPLLPWLALKPDLNPALAQWLGSGKPHGDLRRVALHWSRAHGVQAVALAFTDLGIDPVGKLPGVSGLHGEVRGDAQALSLELPAQAATLQFPEQFAQPFVLSKLAGTLALWSQGGDRHLGVDSLRFEGAGYAGRARGEVVLPAAGGSAFVDMYASVDHADVVAAKLFWPRHGMSPHTQAWLNRALVAGQVDQAQVLLRGNLGDWPFAHHQGRFEARAVIRDLTLDYGKDWPRGEHIDAVASFVNNGMLVQVGAGQSQGLKIDQAVALIPDFHGGLLDLNVKGSGSGASLMNFVRNSPVGRKQAETLAKLQLGGSGTFDLHLALPMKHIEDLQLNGVAQLHDADLTAPAWNLTLSKLNGPLRFDAHGLVADALDAGFLGQPARVRLAIGDGAADPATVLSASLRGRYRMDELVANYPSLHWLGPLADGRSDFDIGFTLAHQADSDALSKTLSVDSSLAGIALNLPAPLRKPAASSMPLHLRMSLPTGGSDVQLGLGQVLRGHLRLPATESQKLAGTLRLGTVMPQTLPSQDLRIRGHAATLDVTGWIQQVAGGSAGGGPGLESIDVGTDRAVWFDRSLGAMKLRAVPKPDVLSVDVDGVAMAGNFSVPTTELDKRGVTVRLQRLFWPNKEGVAASGSATVANTVTTAAAGAATAAAPTAALPTDPARTGIAPAALPPFHIWVGKLRMGAAKLGEARLETWPTANGLHIEQLRALSPQVKINASGDWNGSANASRSHMRINFAAKDLGAMLGAFGFDGLVMGGKTRAQLDASWPGSPSDISLATMNGSLKIDVTDGRIPEAASPGVGRLLGLVSLTELPRRLTLDFGDVFGKGLAFDSITGDFQLADGNATTDNLRIDGSAANISISGRTGLRAHDYDQQMVVVPHVGNSLPLVGAVVGGPIGAVAGFAVQGLLGKGLNKAASARYHITGSWDDPVMTLVEKRGPPPPTSTPLLNPPGSTTAPAVTPPLLSRPAPASSSRTPAASGSVVPAPAASAIGN